MLAAVLALVAVEGQTPPATYATSGPAAPNESRTVSARPAAEQTVTANARPAATDAAGASARPDFTVSIAHVDDAQAGQPFSFTLRLRNDGGAAGVASVSTMLPPALANVRVTAPGFACTRRFSASGPQAGTLVSCSRNDLERGATAEVIVEANAPTAGGTFLLTATADPRDEIVEADESNNDATATLQVRA